MDAKKGECTKNVWDTRVKNVGGVDVSICPDHLLTSGDGVATNGCFLRCFIQMVTRPSEVVWICPWPVANLATNGQIDRQMDRETGQTNR